MTRLHAIYQVVEYFGPNDGQIAYITEALQGKDPRFYRELNKSGRA